MEQAIKILAWIAAVFVMILSLPQLINILRTKKTGKINFTSFWIFHIGLLMWTFWSSFGGDELQPTLVANSVCLFLYTIMIGLLYFFKKEFSLFKKKVAYSVLVLILLVWLSFIISRSLSSFKWDSGTQTAMALIFPALTTFAFLPQLIYSWRHKQWKGISIWMYVVYELNNIVWIIWWILLIAFTAGTSNVGPYVGGLMWQLISFTLFGIQFVYTFKYTKKSEIKKVNTK
ncbi:PQ-loop domain-containing transporter [Mycoplasma sp. OR1901]|uniref:PQ-loop domain-containing transporter n=1 Tax=Mycoplasma sp. OR1901 TaxID=2742195 RepID=UPI001583B6C8|nr:PQ-loop domain-containing transporter [Mycoplasma sp. OR1901]QKT05693.1 hypothetical protein HTZ87_03215 [Mycoplasma sp. OR1901]